jgi:poly(ADP-ribose) glycohydrolase ARH3
MEGAALRAKFLGALVGTAIGDAVGAGFEGRPPADIQEIESAADSKALLAYTDDTHMMIGVAESLVEKEGFDSEHMVQVFIRNYELEPWRGYGPGPPSVFRMIRDGEPWDKAADKLYRGGSYGNGSAMRVAPIAVFYHDDLTMLREVAYRSSRITHSHFFGQEGAALQSFAIALATGSEPGESFDQQEFLSGLTKLSQHETYRKKLETVRMLLEGTDNNKVVAELGNTVEAFNSVPTAIYSFLSHHDSFKAAVLFAASLGGDTDTIAAMTGAISGAYLGIESVPEEWRMKLENHTYIEELAAVLYDVWERWRKKPA